MKRLSALLISLWLGLQLGFSAIVSPVLFTSELIDNTVATHIINTLFNVANGVGMVAWSAAFLVCKPKVHWGQTSNALRKWIGVMLLCLLISLCLLNPSVANYPHYFVVDWLGGSLGTWRGSLHVFNLLIGLLGVILCFRLLSLNHQSHY